MMNDTLQKVQPYYLQLTETMKQRIWNGYYKPGERLYEAQLAKQFNISRSPVREAVRTLINEGLLVVDENAQMTVYEPSLQDVNDIYACRLSLESTAVALATERATPEQLQQLEHLLQETSIAIQEEEDEKIAVCNAAFHDQLIQMSGNVRLKKIVDELHALTFYYRLLNVKGPERARTILKGHTEIVEAMKEKDREKAIAKLTEHTREDLENLVQVIGQKKE